jgi:murein DD-endopeptidase MepM/ murein hydrolase activator NlpD
MQLFWVSGSTGSIKQINITKKSVLRLVAVVGCAFCAFGILIFYTGITIAFEVNPELAKEVTGVVTPEERSRLDGMYRRELASYQERLKVASTTFNELKAIKDRYLAISTPSTIKEKLLDPAHLGGPLKPVNFQLDPTKALVDNLEDLANKSNEILDIATKLEPEWQKQYSWLRSLPIGPPIDARLGMTSNFGVRIDPITQQLAQHSGIDFITPTGTPIVASGDGTVIRSAFDPAYGNFVEIAHNEGFVSKYAHNSKLLVKVGQLVKRGQVIAQSGSTGRSTGPHLHYEIHQNSTYLNPAKILVYAPPSKYW